MSLPKLYLETTIPSYLAARRSRDLRLAADQETTEEWWETKRHEYALFTSEVVEVEASAGDTGTVHTSCARSAQCWYWSSRASGSSQKMKCSDQPGCQRPPALPCGQRV